MQRTKLIESEVGLGTNLANGSTVSNATVLRVYNGSGGVATVSIAKSTPDGYTGISTVSLPIAQVEFFEKMGADLIWASASSVKAAKVGFTN